MEIYPSDIITPQQQKAIHYLKRNGYKLWLQLNVFHVYTKIIGGKIRRVVVWFRNYSPIRVYTKE